VFTSSKVIVYIFRSAPQFNLICKP